MNQKTEPGNAQCHVETAIAVIGGKWKPWILWHLYDGVRRHGELRRLTPGITSKMLTQHLRELERDGIVQRKVFAQKLPKVEYSFSKYGRTLRPLLKKLCDWGMVHGERQSSMATQGE
jgi:DNA-binding HxlR family transcriptional regulator